MAAATWRCPSDGCRERAELASTNLFCNMCGERRPTPLVCSKCNQTVPPLSISCFCGESLVGDDFFSRDSLNVLTAKGIAISDARRVLDNYNGTTIDLCAIRWTVNEANLAKFLAAGATIHAGAASSNHGPRLLSKALSILAPGTLLADAAWGEPVAREKNLATAKDRLLAVWNMYTGEKAAEQRRKRDAVAVALAPLVPEGRHLDKSRLNGLTMETARRMTAEDAMPLLRAARNPAARRGREEHPAQHARLDRAAGGGEDPAGDALAFLNNNQ